MNRLDFARDDIEKEVQKRKLQGVHIRTFTTYDHPIQKSSNYELAKADIRKPHTLTTMNTGRVAFYDVKYEKQGQKPKRYANHP